MFIVLRGEKELREEVAVEMKEDGVDGADGVATDGGVRVAAVAAVDETTEYVG